MLAVLRFIRDLLREARSAPRNPYRSGYTNALEDVEEWILEEMWKEGEDDDE